MVGAGHESAGSLHLWNGGRIPYKLLNFSQEGLSHGYENLESFQSFFFVHHGLARWQSPAYSLEKNRLPSVCRYTTPPARECVEDLAGQALDRKACLAVWPFPPKTWAKNTPHRRSIGNAGHSVLGRSDLELKPHILLDSFVEADSSRTLARDGEFAHIFRPRSRHFERLLVVRSSRKIPLLVLSNCQVQEWGAHLRTFDSLLL